MPRVPAWIFYILVLLYLPALTLDTMDVDASQYAEMAREMTHCTNWLELYDRGGDYLDKPPFLFWISAGSMKLFGPTNFAYKLPSLLFALLALYATYRIGRRLYGENTGRAAALVLGSCQGLFLMTNDVRTDTVLMGWVATAIWAMVDYEGSGRRWKWLLLAAVAVAGGLMTKGPVALLVPAFAIGADAVMKRQWRRIFDPRYLAALAVVAVLLIPVCVGLYQQYDLHPEKIIDGKSGVSGLRFFFWSQSFGRITGESPWENGAGPEFLLVNMLWAFLPWILLFLAALVRSVRTGFRQRLRLQPHQEAVSAGGFLLTYLALGSSRYQLPHYIFVAFPLAAIMVAALLKRFFEGDLPRLHAFFRPVQTGMGALLLVGVALIITLVFPAGAVGIALWAGAVALWLVIVRKRSLPGKVLWVSVASILLTNAFLTSAFYRPLLRYQLGSVAGRYIYAHHIDPKTFLAYRVDDPMNALHFHARHVLKTRFDSGYVFGRRFTHVLTGSEGLQDLTRAGFTYTPLLRLERFKVSELTLPFLNRATRPDAMKPFWIVRLR